MILGLTIDWQKLGQTRPGVNVSDRRTNWKDNYRVPDVAVFLNETCAENCGSFWFGGPDFGIEITSEGDRIPEKLPFYARVRTRELLVIDRDPWTLTLYRNNGSEMIAIAKSTFEASSRLDSEVLPMNWQLVGGESGRSMHVTHQQHADQSWWIAIG